MKIFTRKRKIGYIVISSITPIKRKNDEIVSVVFIFRNTNEMISILESLNQKSIEVLNEKNIPHELTNDYNPNIHTNSYPRATVHYSEQLPVAHPNRSSGIHPARNETHP